MPSIIEFHTVQVRKTKRTMLIFGMASIPGCFGKLKEVSHVRYSGKEIIVGLSVKWLCIQGYTEIVGQSISLEKLVAHVFSLIHVPYESQLYTFRIDVLSKGVDNPVSVASFWTVNNIVFFIICCKANSSILYSCNIIRMGIDIHIVVHIVVSLFAVIITKHLHESISKENGYDALIYKLIESEGNYTMHDCCFFDFVEFILLHKNYLHKKILTLILL